MTLPLALATEGIPLTSAVPEISGSKNLRRVLKEVDDLHKRHRHEEEYKYLQQLVSTDESIAENVDLLWRMARAAFYLARDKNADKQRRAEFLREAHILIQKSMKLQDSDPEVHKWFAVIEGNVTRGFNFTKTIGGALVVREHVLMVLSYSPHDAAAHFMMSSWCYHVAKLNRVERGIVAILYPSFPKSSYDESLDYFEKGEALCPGSATSTDLMVAANCYLRCNRKEDCMTLLQRVSCLPVRTIDDQMAHDECVKLLKTIGENV